MSHKLIVHSPDLKQLLDEGYNLEIRDNHAIVHDVPFVNEKGEIQRGSLVTNLDLQGDRTRQPQSHVMYFMHRSHPCDKKGHCLSGIKHSSQSRNLTQNIRVDHSFSAKPPSGRYNNYYHKFIEYINILSSHAKSIDSNVSAQTGIITNSIENDVFHYVDTNSTRSAIANISAKLSTQKIGIIGIGGTGSYLLDFISKTPVQEIHIFDGDTFEQHNAFRAPGAPSIDQLRERSSKAQYFKAIYDRMHKGIFSYETFIDEHDLVKLNDLNFIFIAIDNGTSKKRIIEHLVANSLPFIDCGLGIQEVDESLIGTIRTTAGLPDNYGHLSKTISYSDDHNDEYATNIQIAELNALNAATAVIKWKKHLTFYKDLSTDLHETYMIETGATSNEAVS